MPASADDLDRIAATLESLRSENARLRRGEQVDESESAAATVDVLLLAIEQRRRASARLQAAQAWMELAQEAGGVGAYDYDIATAELNWSAAIHRLFGFGPEVRPTLDAWIAAVHPADREAVSAGAQRAMDEGRPIWQQYRILLADGQTRWIEDRGTVLFDAGGNPRQIVGLTIDVTQLMEFQEHTAFLMNELNHRVKNTMATIQAMTRQTLKSSGVSAEVRAGLEGRLLAMAQAHDVLTRRNWKAAEVAEIVALALQPHCADPDRFRLTGEPAELDARNALALSMTLHELCTNAAKYGSLSGEAGQVEISWTRARQDGADLLRLVWEETGGPDVRPPGREGFGSQMIRQAFNHDPAARIEVDFRPSGVRCEICASLGPDAAERTPDA